MDQTASAAASPPMDFHRFPLFPPEIRLHIWREAILGVKCPSTRVVVNFDLNHAQAIVASPRPADDSSDWSGYSTDDNSEFEYVNKGATQYRGPIPAMLHVCTESRKVARARYRLDLYSSIPGENTPWWNPEEDVVYLPSFEARDVLNGRLYASLSSVQYLALPLRRELLDAFDDETIFDPLRQSNSLYEWISNSPHLKSLTLLVSPSRAFDAEGGYILQYEPYDVFIYNLKYYTPSYIEQLITKKFEALKLQWDPPSVEVLVMGFRKPVWSERLNRAAVA